MSALRPRDLHRERDPEHALGTMTRALTTREIERFADAGVNVNAYPIRAATVALHAGRFSLAGELRIPDGLLGAFILPVLDGAGYVADLACWVPSTGALATWQGCSWALGQNEFPAPLHVLRSDGAIMLFRDPLSWLQADRRGLVIVDPAQARWRLLQDGGPFLVQEAEHGRELRKIVDVPQPKILLPRHPENRSAA